MEQRGIFLSTNNQYLSANTVSKTLDWGQSQQMFCSMIKLCSGLVVTNLACRRECVRWAGRDWRLKTDPAGIIWVLVFPGSALWQISNIWSCSLSLLPRRAQVVSPLSPSLPTSSTPTTIVSSWLSDLNITAPLSHHHHNSHLTSQPQYCGLA